LPTKRKRHSKWSKDKDERKEDVKKMICQMCKNRTTHITGIRKDDKQIWVCVICRDIIMELNHIEVEQ
jgi:hypothetical protein